MKYIRYVMLLCVAALFQTSFAAVSVPKFEKDFKDLISRSKLAVVHFINYDLLPLDEEDKTEVDALIEQLDDLKEDFTDISNDDDFAVVRFVGVDLRAVPDLADDYDIKDLSTFILFKDGKPFKRRGEVVKRTGILSLEDLEDWIEEYFEDFTAYVQIKKPVTRVTRYIPEPSYQTRSYYRPYRPYYRPYRSYWRRGYYRPYRHRGFYGYRPYGYRYGGYGYGRGFGFGIGGRRGGVGFGFGW